jgi:predicted nucleic acid-binding protein
VVLVDTSVWVEVFRRPSRVDLPEVVNLDEVVTCLLVVQEVLQGFPVVESPLRSDVFDEAVHLYRAARRAGQTVRSGVDCLVAACALRHGLTVLHHDRDFDTLASISTLRAQTVRLAR